MTRPQPHTAVRRPRRAIRRLRRRAAAAFSLVEVLIAVLILALGLLGLGAIFPVVIREQRIGNELTIGVIAGNSARAKLDAMDTALAADQPDFWVRWRNELTPHNNFRFGQWLPATISDPARGTIQLGDNNSEWFIPVSQRLYPVGEGRAGQPQFVWDVAIHRVWDGDDIPDNDALRLALFVRRIDPRIRVPANFNLYGVLTNPSVPAADRRVPVGEDNNGVATLDGHGGGGQPNYSGIKTIGVEFKFDPNNLNQRFRDRLYYAGSGSSANSIPWRQVSQPNQKIIDNLGNVYTVVDKGVGDGGTEYIRITPPVPSHIDRFSKVQIVQVAFTPQVPAAIVTWTVDPRRQLP